MKNFVWWMSVFGAVVIASLTDSVSTLWAKGNFFSIYFILILILGPLVFITFGIVTHKSGLAITSGVVNSLLVLSSISVGLFFFGERTKISPIQYLGMLFALAGIVLMIFFPKIES